MIPLNGQILGSTITKFGKDQIVRLSTNPNLPDVLKAKEIYVLRGDEPPEGFWGYIKFPESSASYRLNDLPSLELNEDMSYLEGGDVIKISSDLRKIRVLY